MNYVFALLKDNDQFEYLLRKGEVLDVKILNKINL